MPLIRIISGGQTGADQGAISAAKTLGLKTGGWMPKGWRTESGPNPDLARKFGMWEHQSSQYPPRTKANVLASDATLLFGNSESAGSRLTLHFCNELVKPIYIQYWTSNGSPPSRLAITTFRLWIALKKIRTLNVAGNRESTQPGIHDACRDFLLNALKLEDAQ